MGSPCERFQSKCREMVHVEGGTEVARLKRLVHKMLLLNFKCITYAHGYTAICSSALRWGTDVNQQHM